jgi:hypothetical protein
VPDKARKKIQILYFVFRYNISYSTMINILLPDLFALLIMVKNIAVLNVSLK